MKPYLTGSAIAHHVHRNTESSASNFSHHLNNIKFENQTHRSTIVDPKIYKPALINFNYNKNPYDSEILGAKANHVKLELEAIDLNMMNFG